MMRDHGGDLERARSTFGEGRWLDLSTGINPVAYPVPELSQSDWARLPGLTALRALRAAAGKAYGTDRAIVPVSGAQSAIQLIPHLRPTGRAAVIGPTYNEHAAAFRAQGWRVEDVTDLEQAKGADLAVVVNPNNPDGRVWSKASLLDLKSQTGCLVVDESFADPNPELSFAALAADDLVVLRSFGKFYGLAGLRLGFVITGDDTAARLRALSGPWAVNGPALKIGAAALLDEAWQTQTCVRLNADVTRLDALARAAGWSLVGGTALFRTYDTGDAAMAQDKLARARVWSRIFPYSTAWLRLGLPGDEADWAQLEKALS